MFKYIAVQVKPGTEDFGYVFDDDGLNPSGGDFNYTLFIFRGNDCQFNDDIYSDYESAIDNLVDDLYDYLEDDSFANHLDYVKEAGFNTDNDTVRLLDYCVKCAADNDYPEALAAYLEAKTGQSWNTAGVSGYTQGDYCTLVYCDYWYSEESINYYGKMWLGCGGEFYLDELKVPNVYADELDFSDFYSIEPFLEGDTVYGCFIVDDIIWNGGKKLISEVADCFDVSESKLEVYVYENGTYVNAKDM